MRCHRRCFVETQRTQQCSMHVVTWHRVQKSPCSVARGTKARPALRTRYLCTNTIIDSNPKMKLCRAVDLPEYALGPKYVQSVPGIFRWKFIRFWVESTSIITSVHVSERITVHFRIFYLLLQLLLFLLLCPVAIITNKLYRSENLDGQDVTERTLDVDSFCPREMMELRSVCSVARSHSTAKLIPKTPWAKHEVMVIFAYK